MTATTNKQQIYGEYINPTIDQYSSKRENPLVLMAQACNNIGKELSSSIKQSSPPPFLSKQRKSNSPREGNKSLKRTASITSLSPPPTANKISSTNQQSFYVPPLPFMFDSLLLHHLNKTLPFGYSSNSAFTPSTSQRSTYFMDSILSSSSSFVCNWMNGTIPDGFCGKRFSNHNNLLEHLCTEHTSIKSYYSLTNLYN